MQSFILLFSLLAGPALHGTYNIRMDGIIDDNKVTEVLNVFEKLPAEVRVVINSPGGNVSAAEGITNVFMFGRANGIKVRCMVDGEASSAAFWILEACGERMATPKSRFMAHSPYIVATGQIVLTIPLLEEFLEELIQDDRQLAAVVAPRLGMTPDSFRLKLRAAGIQGWRFGAIEAISLHAIDSIYTDDTNKFVPSPPKAQDLMCMVR